MSKLEKHVPIALCGIVAIVIAGCAGESPPAKQAAGSPKAPRKTTSDGPSCNAKEGAKAPALAIDSMNAGKASIVPGKVTLVDFWATWCKPCEKSFPAYQALYTKYKSRGFEVIAVAVDEPDTKAAIPGFIKKAGAKFPVGWDDGHTFAECWKLGGMPAAYIIDKKGVVRHIHDRWLDDSEKLVEAQIKALL